MARMLALMALAAAATAGTARADFPYAPGSNVHKPDTFRLAPAVIPNDFSEALDWKLAATPDSPLANPMTAMVNSQPDELCGVAA